MQFTVGLGRNETLDQIPELARVAEAGGFSHLTVIDVPFAARDQYVMMTLAVLNTSRIFIGQGVTSPITYHPVTTANATATIDELSGGRAFLGIGIGALGVEAMKPVSLDELREVILFIRKFMSGEEVEWKGHKIRSGWIRRPVPIYIASGGPRSLQLAGEVADGVICYGVHPEMWKWYLEQIEKGAARAGRDPSKIDTWARTVCRIAESKEAARPEVASYNTHTLAQLYGRNHPDILDLRQRLERAEPGIFEESMRVYQGWDEHQNQQTDAPYGRLATQRLIDLFALTGRPEEICETIYRLGEVGVKTVSMVTYSVIDKKGMLQQVAEEIIPQFRD